MTINQQLLSPPRISGDAQTDYASLITYLWNFYRVVNANYLTSSQIGTTIQPTTDMLKLLSPLVPVANKFPYISAVNEALLTDITDVGRTFLSKATQISALDYLSPMTTVGDIIVAGTGGTATRLPGNTTVTTKLLYQVGDGVSAGVPYWGLVPGAATYVPYTGANANVDLGAFSITSSSFIGNVTGSSGSCTGNASTSTTCTGNAATSSSCSGNANTATTCTGNANTATTLQTARNINGVSFNGSAAITVPADATTLTNGAGTYTPTLTNVANLDASTPRLAQWMRVGNVITVSGQVDVDPTLTATATTLGISLPVASALTTAYQLGGVAFALAIAGQGAGIQADATNDRASMTWVSTDITNQTMSYTFSYEVL